METKAGSILREGSGSSEIILPDVAAAAGNEESSSEIVVVARLEQENARLRKAVEDLEITKKVLIERALKLERLLLLAEGRKQQQQHHYNDSEKGTAVAAGKEEDEETTTVVLPPHLFLKTFTLLRGSTKPLVLRVVAGEAVDIEKMNI